MILKASEARTKSKSVAKCKKLKEDFEKRTKEQQYIDKDMKLVPSLIKEAEMAIKKASKSGSAGTSITWPKNFHWKASCEVREKLEKAGYEVSIKTIRQNHSKDYTDETTYLVINW